MHASQGMQLARQSTGRGINVCWCSFVPRGNRSVCQTHARFVLADFCSTQEDTGRDGLTWQTCWPKSGKTNETLADMAQLLYESDCSYAISFSDGDPASFQEALDEMWSDSSAECKVRPFNPCACRSRTRWRLRCEASKRVANATRRLTWQCATCQVLSAGIQIEMAYLAGIVNDSAAARLHGQAVAPANESVHAVQR